MYRNLAVITALLFCLSGAAQGQGPSVIEGPGSTLSQSARRHVPHSPPLPYGLQLMAHFDLLPTLRDTKCVQDSSYDRSGGNGDSGNFLRREGNKAILADLKGPGCVYRFWSANAAGHLRIFFDGESQPRIDCPMQDLFLGKVAPFVAPIVGHRSGGWYSFFPMPFARGCRIEVTDPGSMYYHVETQLFPDDTPVRTFTTELTPEDATALAAIVRQWRRTGDSPYRGLNEMLTADVETHAGEARSLPAGQTKTLLDLHGSGVVQTLRLKITPADRNTLRQTVLRITWDGAKRPAIEAPVGDFFGTGFGDQRFKALPDAMTDAGGVCYWPMPFARSAHFELVNAGKTDLAGITWQVTYRKLSRPLKDVGYFHAQWHRQTTVTGEHFHILQTTGRGHYVGEHTDMQGDRGIWFLEGDEKIYVDGETFPSIYGTGTEDFYTGGWYFDEGPFNLAYHGCILKNEDLSRIAAYRYQIQDCVPFQHDIKVDIEHGPGNDYPGADYSCVAYWYQDAPTHDWSPIDPADLVPAKLRFEGAIEAETLAWSGTPAEIRPDTALPIEASGGKYVALPGGETGESAATFTLHADRDDVYRVHIVELIQPDSPPTLHLTWPGATGQNPNDLVLSRPAGQVDRYDYSFPMRLLPGDHPFTLQTPAGKTCYVDYVRLSDVSHEHNVIEAESLAEKATSNGGTVTRLDGIDVQTRYGESVMNALSGRGMLEWAATGQGATLLLPLTVPADGDYELELGVAPLTEGPKLNLDFDNSTATALDLSTLPVTTPPGNGFQVQRMHARRLPGLTAGPHILTLVNASGKAATLDLDYIRLQKSLYANAIEAEGLRVLDSHDGDTQTQDMKGFGKGWSDDAQFWFLAQKPGAEATLELPAIPAGRYTLVVYYTTARDYGISQVLVDGNPVGSPTDCYTPNVLPKGRTELGKIDLAAGTHRITFRVTGKNAASTGYLLGVDAIGLEP